jgi:hypothetical protein
MHTGDEKSPLGLGYAPDGELPKLVMKGKDGNMWMVSVKNGVKVWVKVPDEVEDLEKDTPIIEADKPAPPKKVAKPKAVKKPEVVEQVVEEQVAEVAESDKEDKEEEPIKPAKKVATKKVVAKKKVVVEPAEEKVEDVPKKKRPLSDYQRFMKLRRDELAAVGVKFDLTAVAAEWKALTPEMKADAIARMNA